MHKAPLFRREQRGLQLSVIFFLAGCATANQPAAVSSFDALRLHEAGKIVVVDVRSAAEMSAGQPKQNLPHIQFGPDDWGPVTEEHVRDFAEKLAPILRTGKPVVLLCLRAVRSEAAAHLLAHRGVSVGNISDGYLGNGLGPGWRAWE